MQRIDYNKKDVQLHIFFLCLLRTSFFTAQGRNHFHPKDGNVIGA